MTRAFTSLVALVVLSLPIASAAQGLAEAARRAEAQRKADERAPVVLSARGDANDGWPPRLTAARLARYVEARLALAALKRSNYRVDDAWRAAGGATYMELHDKIAKHAEVTALLMGYDFTTLTYFAVEMDIVRGVLGRAGSRQLDKRERENYEYVRANAMQVRELYERCVAAERGLASAGVQPTPW